MSFRSLAAMSAKERNAALAVGSFAYIFSDWVDARFDLPEPDLIGLSFEGPETAARSLRQKWGLGELPIKNMLHVLEAKGVRVFSLAENDGSWMHFRHQARRAPVRVFEYAEDGRT